MKFFHVDAFATTAHAGNPAAVCFLTTSISKNKMQALATELNQPATAFVQSHPDPFANKWQLNWFSPTKEYDLCGHATLAAAFVLWSEGIVRPDRPIRFQSDHHLLRCTYDTRGWITMRFPTAPVEATDAPKGLLQSLGINDVLFIGKTTTDHYVIEVPEAEMVRQLAPDFVALSAFNLRGVAVTSEADDERYDFISRYFSAENRKEDSVTGTSHCRLAPYWAEKLGRNKLVGYQTSLRGGSVRMDVDGNEVALSGQAVMLIRGELM